jgi:hypothetical protein
MAEAITARGGDYVLAMKGNQPALLLLVEVLLPHPHPGRLRRPDLSRPKGGRSEKPLSRLRDLCKNLLSFEARFARSSG